MHKQMQKFLWSKIKLRTFHSDILQIGILFGILHFEFRDLAHHNWKVNQVLWFFLCEIYFKVQKYKIFTFVSKKIMISTIM
jgi:hypothetical protein